MFNLIEFMEYPKEILVKDYFEIHDYYSKIYGVGRTMILMQVGSFHEAYCTDTDGLDLVDLADKLDVNCTRKNKNIPLSKTNPRMMGFPTYVTYNYIDKLIDLNYTVVIIDQTTEPPNPKRQVSNIYSPATYINKKTIKQNYLLSIVLSKAKDSPTTYQICIGLCAYDLSTGEGFIYETSSKSSDTLLGLDDAIRFMETYPPREIILQNNLLDDDKIANMSSSEILDYLNINLSTTYVIKTGQHDKKRWQYSLLNKIFKPDTDIDIFEKIGINNFIFARTSLALLLDYVESHQPCLVEQLKIPILFSSNTYLYLGNRALQQLDVIINNDTKTSLFTIIDNTTTVIGRRYLLSQLSRPLIDATKINNRYDAIEKIIRLKDTKIGNYLKNLSDIDKLVRKLEINTINPSELYQLYLSFCQINKLFNYLKQVDLLDNFNLSQDLIDNIKILIDWITGIFITTKLEDINFNNFIETEQSIYNNFDDSIIKHNDLKILQKKINSTNSFMDNFTSELEKLIDDKIYLKKNKDEDEDSKSLITLKCNERDGHYLLITNRRCKILKQNLNKLDELKIGDSKIKINEIEFNELPKSSNTKISCERMNHLSTDLIEFKKEMAVKIKEYFKKDMIVFNGLFNNLLHDCSQKIGYIDFINSGALCAQQNHYSKPIINIKQSSFFKAKELRHPIMESLNKQTHYIPHDIELGFETEQNGILLYGINSSGKSTLMKSIGLNIILAQIGYYTASTNFEYSPYFSLFTRISGNDDMFKGLSSFMVEMVELMAILKRNNNNTLMIGDEICRGTEEKSANIIVCYMLETLTKSNSSFITATHLHQIANLESVKKLNRLKSKHLKITYDSQNDMLIYDRHLSDGQGETFYGLQVAKFLMKDKQFNDRTAEILKEYDDKVDDKFSKYNSNVIINCCEICKGTDKLETHHIVWQKDFNENDINHKMFHLQKNEPSNLVILCSKCHDDVDRNKIIINGWIDTSKGPKFDYKIIDLPIQQKSNNKKYPDEIITFLKSIKEKVNEDAKIARIEIIDKFNRKITTKTINTLWA